MKKIKNFLADTIVGVLLFVFSITLSVLGIKFLWRTSPIVYWGKKGYYYIMQKETPKEELKKAKKFMLDNSILKEMKEIVKDPNLDINFKLNKIEYGINNLKREIENSNLNKQYKEMLLESKYVENGLVIQLKYILNGASYYVNGLYELNNSFIDSAQHEFSKVVIFSDQQYKEIVKVLSKTKNMIKKAKLGTLKKEEVEEVANMANEMVKHWNTIGIKEEYK